MRVYTIHLPPPYSGRDRDPEVIREGFSFWAFLLTFLWALFNRMFLIALALVLGLAALGVALGALQVNPLAEGVITLAAAIWIGCSANDWRRAHLARKGWKEAAVVAAPDANAALRRYADLAAWSPAPSAPA